MVTDSVGSGSRIVARMASDRFPGKAVADLYGQPMIGWIIEKATTLGGPVIVCATDDPLDDELSRVAHMYGIECARGPVKDFEAQYALATDMLGITHWVEWSGDSPFADPEIGRRIMAAIVREPDKWSYAAGPHPSGTAGIHVAGGSVDKLRAYEAIRDRPETKHMLANGWCWYAAPELEDGGTGKVDIADLFDMPRSLFAMCIDYPLQLDFFNRIARWVGHFPTWQEIELAHRKMRSLGGEL